ncbi:MAG: hypothetical protein KDC53_06925 [Saprospiraceae bacterium]|nr:hypothetical protein [Saprospiraceae bacterium]
MYLDFILNVMFFVLVAFFIIIYLGDIHCWLAGALGQGKYRDYWLRQSPLVAFFFLIFGTILLLPFMIQYLLKFIEDVLAYVSLLFGLIGEYIRYLGEEFLKFKLTNPLQSLAKFSLLGIGYIFISLSVLVITTAGLITKLTSRRVGVA